MLHKEVIGILYIKKDCADYDGNYCKMDINITIDGKNGCNLCESAMDIAIDSVEKQIAKNPVWEYLGDSLSRKEIVFRCPRCGNPIEEKEHHCECGQAILWEE